MNGQPTATGVFYSVSQLKLFEQCPLRYRYHYVERIKSLLQTIESYVGMRVREAIEYLHLHIQNQTLLPVSEVVTHYRLRWESLWDSTIRISHPQQGREWYRRYGEKCVRHYYTSQYPFQLPGEVAFDVEWSFEFPLREDRPYKMRGHIDRLTKNEDESLTVHDYKTSPFVPKLRTLLRDVQPGVYQLAVQKLHPDAPRVNVSWHYLARNRKLHPTRTETQLERLQCLLIQKIEKIEQAKVFEPQTSPACFSCEYRDTCPAFEAYAASQAETAALGS